MGYDAYPGKISHHLGLNGTGIGTAHDGDARSDLKINGGEAAEENVIEHNNGTLAKLVPGRVKMTSFRCVENGLNPFNMASPSSCLMLSS
jgi:hypothetical protein